MDPSQSIAPHVSPALAQQAQSMGIDLSNVQLAGGGQPQPQPQGAAAPVPSQASPPFPGGAASSGGMGENTPEAQIILSILGDRMKALSKQQAPPPPPPRDQALQGGLNGTATF